MRKHKIISLILVGILTLTSLTGCGQKQEVVQTPIQDLFFENMLKVTNYENIEFETISTSKTLVVEDTSNPLTSSLFEDKQYIEESFYSRGGLDVKNLSFGLNFGMLENNNRLDFMKLISNSKASYINISGLLKNFDKILETKAFKKIEESATSTNTEKVENEEDISININMEEFLNEESMMFISLLVGQIGNMLGDNYILLDYNELEQKPEDNESLTNDLNSLKENLDKVPKYMNLIKLSFLLNFKAVDDSYQNTLVNYDKDGNYYYFAFTPDLFKDFCKKYVSSLEGNYYTQFPILYKQIMGEDFVVTDEMTMEVREYCDELNKSIDEFDYNFEKMIVAFFFSNNSLKVVTETTIDVDNSSTSTMIIKNSPDLIFNSPSNAKSFEETMESLSEIFSSGLMGGFGTEDTKEDDEGFDEFENTGSKFEIDEDFGL